MPFDMRLVPPAILVAFGLVAVVRASRDRSDPGRRAAAVSIALTIGLTSFVMWMVLGFMFHFSGAQCRNGPVVQGGAQAAVGALALLATGLWALRSRGDAVRWTGVATPLVWALTYVVVWIITAEIERGGRIVG